MFRRAGILVLAVIAFAQSCGTGPTVPSQTQSSQGVAAPQVVFSGTVTESDGTALAGASVSAVAGSKGGVTTTDAHGSFSITLQPAYPGQSLYVRASAPQHVILTEFVTVTGSTTTVTIPLERNVSLIIGTTMSSSVSANDPPIYVGEDYDSDYLYDVKSFNYSTTSGPVVVELSYAAVGNAKLTMYSVSGTVTSASTAGHQSIVLPTGVADVLLVGQAYEGGRLAQAVPFTLTSRAATPEDLLPQANLEIVSFVVGPVDLGTGSYTFHPDLTVRETGGTSAATIKSVEFSSAAGTRTTLTSSDCFRAAIVSAGQTWTMLDNTYSGGCRDFRPNIMPSSVSVTVHFADLTGRTGSVSATAAVGSGSR